MEHCRRVWTLGRAVKYLSQSRADDLRAYLMPGCPIDCNPERSLGTILRSLGTKALLRRNLGTWGIRVSDIMHVVSLYANEALIYMNDPAA
ncbi:hypothetical protein NDU88_001125 [Pleurodeles waltl]|uniref:Uncharacterized protein n=1 Tax=Pleurodeles waltl TaxID=8319 RepID=A0AAV7L8L1_PLEWA|nr:hypothetical protein NDU88_001125 [Pleurodeles waltl]